MNSLKLSTLVFALAFAAWVGCGSSTGGGTGGSIGAGGAGGGMGGAGGAGVVVDGGGGSDVPIQPDSNSSESVPVDVMPLDVGPGGCLQDHEHIINPDPTCLPSSVLQQDPGPNPTPGFPACSAI
jgi:hypothetical protein